MKNCLLYIDNRMRAAQTGINYLDSANYMNMVYSTNNHDDKKLHKMPVFSCEGCAQAQFLATLETVKIVFIVYHQVPLSNCRKGRFLE